MHNSTWDDLANWLQLDFKSLATKTPNQSPCERGIWKSEIIPMNFPTKSAWHDVCTHKNSQKKNLKPITHNQFLWPERWLVSSDFLLSFLHSTSKLSVLMGRLTRHWVTNGIMVQMLETTRPDAFHRPSRRLDRMEERPTSRSCCVCVCVVWFGKETDQSYQRMEGWCFGELGMLSGF